MNGELYRLVSPYETSLAALSYVAPDQSKAVVYMYQTEDGGVPQVRLDGLDAGKKYLVREVSLPDDMKPRFVEKSYSGSELMEKGLDNPLNVQFDSAVLMLTGI